MNQCRKTEFEYCCVIFRHMVEEKIFVHAEDEHDETEWFIPCGAHIYYCPFCGSFIKGKGYGEAPKPFKSMRKDIDEEI